MSDPSNVSERAKQDVERHLILTRQVLTPSAAFRERVRGGLAAPGPALPASPEASTQPLRASGSWQALRASGKAGFSAGASLLAAGFLVGYLSQQDAGVPPPLPVPRYMASSELDTNAINLEPAASVGVMNEPKTPPPAAVVPEGGVPARRRAANRANIEAPPSATAALSASPQNQQGVREELVLLQRAERAVRTGNAALALALTAEFDQRYPRSRLVEERHAIELMAYCLAGATDSAARSARFQRAYPSSVYAERIATVCPMGTTAKDEDDSDKSRVLGH